MLNKFLFLSILLISIPIASTDDDDDNDDDQEEDLYTMEVDTDGETSEYIINDDDFDTSSDNIETQNEIQEQIQDDDPGFDVEFINNSGETVKLFWDDGQAGVFMADMINGAKVPMNTFEDHKFFFTSMDDTNNKIETFVMTPSLLQYTLLSKEMRNEARRQFEKEKNEFMKNYYERTGIRWGNTYPRDPVIHYMHDIREIGQTIDIESEYTQFNKCDIDEHDNKDEIESNKNNGLYNDQINSKTWYYYNETYYCQDKSDKMKIKLEVLCTKPKVIRIYNFLSNDECESIINLGIKQGLQRSTVGQGENIEKTIDRTSETVWLERRMSEIVNNIVKRISNVVKIDEKKLFLNSSSEELQLVHYYQGQLYKSHVDWEVGEHNRYITFLMYLNDVIDGGETSFPLADKSCKDENNWFGVKPIKKSILMFYDLFKDGNVDQLSQHYAQPPKGEGAEKWMTNLWIWDKKFARL